MSTFSLVLNSNNVINKQSQKNNVLRYDFNPPINLPEGTLMNISQLILPYSWYSISDILGNNTLTYRMPNSANTFVTYNTTIPNGTYSTSDLNTFLQQTLKSNGHYFYSNIGTYGTQFQFVGSIATVTTTSTLTVSSTQSPSVQLIIGTSINGYNIPANTVVLSQTGNYTYTVTNSASLTITNAPMYGSQGSEIIPNIIYPLSIQTNIPQYVNTITALTLPTSDNIQNIFGAGFTYANGADNQPTWTGGYPTSGGNKCPTITIPITNSTTTTLGNFLGFANAASTNYPTTNSGLAVTVLSQTVNGNSLQAPIPFPPLGSPVNGITVRCSLINNGCAVPSDLLETIGITSPFGSNIIFLPVSDDAVSVNPQKSCSSFYLYLCDQNLNPLPCNDPNMLISIIFRLPEKK